ncbi:DUF2651 family protein [Salirhabdus salicampi]|uniref:DUF2651 family protein n=1 Tax=Salirhabdus salicampi TaxID=476102 RepID=UPI00346362A2
MEFLLILLTFPVLVIVVTIIGSFFVNHWIVIPLIVLFLSTLLMFIFFNVTFFMWVLLYTLISFIISFIVMIIRK